ncbi:MAG: hypothetical protein Q7U16_12525 [Agitococcus sp.]|nr:hypothetical protein [Agitococcus sp.]
MLFRLVHYETKSDDKFDAQNRYEYLADKDAIWTLWYTFTEQLKYKHVEVFSLDGTKQDPGNGSRGMVGYNL